MLKQIILPMSSRRNFLKIGAGALSLAALPLPGITGLLGGFHTAYAAAPQSEWVLTGPFGSSYISPINQAANIFNAVGSSWDASVPAGGFLQLFIRTGIDMAAISNALWEEVVTDNVEGPGNGQTSENSGILVITGAANFVQVKILSSGGTSLRKVRIGFIDTRGGPTPRVPRLDPVPNIGAPYIIPRSAWGADESWRFATDGTEIWTTSYRPIQKVIVHHTETSNWVSDPAAAIRSIYYYHAIIRGWGDIGYNFLIDWKGNIYEGRFGGPNVVGGHALQYNWGSLGVSILGNYMNTDITTESYNALVALLAAKVPFLDPHAVSFYIDTNNVPAYAGHRDVMDTKCPGDHLYASLPAIRDSVASRLSMAAQATGEVTSVKWGNATLVSGQTLQVDITVKNTGTVPLATQQPAPGYTYEEGSSFASLNFAKETSAFRVCVDFTDNTGVSHPYRWGLGAPLAPGASTTVTGYIKLNSVKVQSYWAALVEEYIQYWSDNIGTTSTSVIPFPADPVAPLTDPNTRYFSETGHNLGWAFKKYWEQNGGLALYGYPITDEFVEISTTDGQPYTVQYFQRNRFEYHPALRDTPYGVLLGLLGVQVTTGRTFPTVAPFPRPADNSRVYFSQTQHGLGGVFLKWWRSHGALAQFGYPISEEFSEVNPADGQTYTVQYFERARFERHPEFAGTDYEVELGLLGTQVLKERGWLR